MKKTRAVVLWVGVIGTIVAVAGYLGASLLSSGDAPEQAFKVWSYDTNKDYVGRIRLSPSATPLNSQARLTISVDAEPRPNAASSALTVPGLSEGHVQVQFSGEGFDILPNRPRVSVVPIAGATNFIVVPRSSGRKIIRVEGSWAKNEILTTAEYNRRMAELSHVYFTNDIDLNVTEASPLSTVFAWARDIGALVGLPGLILFLLGWLRERWAKRQESLTFPNVNQ